MTFCNLDTYIWQLGQIHWSDRGGGVDGGDGGDGGGGGDEDDEDGVDDE